MPINFLTLNGPFSILSSYKSNALYLDFYKETINNTNAQGKKLKTRSYHIPELVIVQGDNPDDILNDIDAVLTDDMLDKETYGGIKRVSQDTQKKFNAAEVKPAFRGVLIAYSEAELKKKAMHMKKMISANPNTPVSYPEIGLFYGMGDAGGKLAYLFPGQGAQYLGMGGALAAAFPEAERVWDDLGEMRFSGESIKEVVFPTEPMEDKEAKTAFFKLAGADWTNPTISVVGEAIYRLLEKSGVRPDAVAGHSFGDVSAFRAAGILSARDMVHATRHRGELGVSCPLATRGCVLVVPEQADRIRSIFETHDIQDVWIANYNTVTQTVLSGVRESITNAQAAFKKEGINTRLMPISAAPHCPLAVDVAEKFAEYLKTLTFSPADCDVYSFVFGRKVKDNDPALFKKLLRSHVEKPVHFIKQIKTMYDDGVRIFVEVGPSDILTGLVHQILEDVPHIAVSTDVRKGDPVLAFLNAVAELFKEGRTGNLQVLWEGYTIPQTASDDDMHVFKDAKTKHMKRFNRELARIEKML